MHAARSYPLDVKFGLSVGLETHPMKAKILESIKIPLKVDDHDKRLKGYGLRIDTWNIHTLHRMGAYAQLAGALIKYKANITAIQEMRWIGQGRKNVNILRSVSQLPC